MENLKKITTRKKVKVIGTQEFVNTSTGEIQEIQMITYEDRDANFHKIWLYHIAEALDLIGNQKTKVLYHIMQNLNHDNLYIGTQRSMAEKLNISIQTITFTIKKLKEANMIKNINNGVYQVNPDIIFKGGKNDRLCILHQYNKI